MSAFGTKRTSRHAQSMSAFGGKADIATFTILWGRQTRCAPQFLCGRVPTPWCEGAPLAGNPTLRTKKVGSTCGVICGQGGGHFPNTSANWGISRTLGGHPLRQIWNGTKGQADFCWTSRGRLDPRTISAELV